MPYYRCVGDVPRKRHLRVPHGAGFLFEELVGQEGFSAESALLYHRCSPSAIVAVDAVDDPVDVALTPDHPLVPRHVRTSDVPSGGDHLLGRRRLLGNADVALSWVGADTSSGLYRNAIGDELTFVQSGGAVLETSFGRVVVGAGDYVVVPRGVTQRWLVDDRLDALVLEAAGHVTLPDRYVTARGQLREGAPFSERDLRGPDEALHVEEGETATSTRTPSTSPTSSRSRVRSTSRRRSTRRSPAPASSSARSCRGRSTSTRRR
jgi:homogentisate 1,2-dioxygenase